MCTSLGDGAAHLDVSSGVVFIGNEISVVARGFKSGERVRLKSNLVDGASVTWAAEANFIADVGGLVDVGNAPSVSGTYVGTDAAGLFWSLIPEGHESPRAFQVSATERAHQSGVPALDPSAPFRVELEAEGLDSGRRAKSGVQLSRLVGEIEVIPLRDGRLRGTVFRWRDRSKPRGAVMSLTGSGGGVELNWAPAIASLGYDVVSLAYFNFADLPPTIEEIPLEYFKEGFEWMQRELLPTKIAVQGGSRGGELSLLLGATYPDIVKGVLGIVPMFCVTPGWNSKGEVRAAWSTAGQPYPYPTMSDDTTIEEMHRIASGLPNGWVGAPQILKDLDEPQVHQEFAIPVERIDGPVLLISGVDDAMWPSTWGANVIVNRLRANGFSHRYEHLALRETGHLVPLPNTVTTFVPTVYHAVMQVFMACGGTPQGAGQAAWKSWAAIKDHYARLFGQTGRI